MLALARACMLARGGLVHERSRVGPDRMQPGYLACIAAPLRCKEGRQVCEYAPLQGDRSARRHHYRTRATTPPPQVMDKHLNIIAKNHLETKVVKVSRQR